MRKIGRIAHAARALATLALVMGVAGGAPGSASASASDYSVRTLHFKVMVGPKSDRVCDVVGDLYTPKGASATHRVPAVLMTNGFSGSKNDQRNFAAQLAEKGYVALTYSGLGFGGSGCPIEIDAPEWDGKAASRLITFLGGGSAATDGTKVDDVLLDRVAHDGTAHAADPRVGMIGGSYGGEVQFAAASVDPRLDTIIPIITWHDLSYSLAPQNAVPSGVHSAIPGVTKYQWLNVFAAAGTALDGSKQAPNDPSAVLTSCPNFDPGVCQQLIQTDAVAPTDAGVAFFRHASVASYMDKIRIPVLLGQGEDDTLFNLQEATATYQALKAQGTPVKMIWQSWGHSGSKPAPGEFGSVGGAYALTNADGKPTYEGTAILDWFAHYLGDDPAAPSLDFTFFRPWVTYTGDATAAYGRAPSYPAVPAQDRYLSGTDALTGDAAAVHAGSTTFATTAAGAPTSYSEVSAVENDVNGPPTDLPGTFARYSTAPLSQDTDIIGIPSVDLTIAAPVQDAAGAAGPAADLVLFFKLYDVAPDGSVTLTNKLISPARIPAGGGRVHVELPGIVSRFPTGHRLALVVAGGDGAYRGNAVAGPVTVQTDPAHPGVLHLPIAPEGSYGRPVPATAPTRACQSGRTFTVRIKAAYRHKLRSATASIRGKVVARLTPSRTSFRLNLKGRPAGKTRLTIRIRLRSGRTVTDVRTYTLCHPSAGTTR